MSKVNYIQNFDEWKADFRFYIPITVRFSETDMFGHVNNRAPFIYFEEGRIAFMKAAGIFSELSTKSDSIPVVADLQCDFHRQMFFGDELKLYVKVNEIGKSSFDIHYLMMNQHGEDCITGRGRIVQIDPKTGKSLPLTDEMKKKLLQD